MDRSKLISKISDPEAMEDIMEIADMNRKVKNGDISKEEAAERVVEKAKENEELRDVLGIIMQQFDYEDIGSKIEEKMIEEFGEEWDNDG